MWNARQTQFIWFANQALGVSATDAFEVFSGGIKPTSSSSQQIPNANAFPGQQQFIGTTEQANGQIENYNVSVVKNLNRLDIIVQPVVTQQSIQSAPLFQDFDEVLNLFDRSKENLSQLVNAVNRMACVTNFVLEAESMARANTKVLDTIGIDADIFKKGSDILFSINRQIVVGEIAFNRTFRFQVEQFINLTVPTPNMHVGGVIAPMQSSPIYAAAMMFDMNTPLPNPKPYGAPDQINRISEMLRATAEVRKLSRLNELSQ